MPDNALCDHFHWNPPAQQLFERSYSFATQATGNNPIEETEVGVYVEGKAVRGDPSRHMHSHGHELVIAHPDPSRSLSSSRTDSKLSSNADKDFFQRVHVPGQVSLVLRQVEDGVSHKLPGSMEGDIPAAISLKNLRSQQPNLFRGEENVFAFCVTPQSINGWMFQQNQSIRNVPRLTRNDALVLEVQSLLIIHNARHFNLTNHLSSRNMIGLLETVSWMPAQCPPLYPEVLGRMTSPLNTECG